MNEDRLIHRVVVLTKEASYPPDGEAGLARRIIAAVREHDRDALSGGPVDPVTEFERTVFFSAPHLRGKIRVSLKIVPPGRVSYGLEEIGTGRRNAVTACEGVKMSAQDGAGLLLDWYRELLERDAAAKPSAAEEAEAAHKFLDDAGVPRGDGEGTFSLQGRIHRFPGALDQAKARQGCAELRAAAGLDGFGDLRSDPALLDKLRAAAVPSPVYYYQTHKVALAGSNAAQQHGDYDKSTGPAVRGSGVDHEAAKAVREAADFVQGYAPEGWEDYTFHVSGAVYRLRAADRSAAMERVNACVGHMGGFPFLGQWAPSEEEGPRTFVWVRAELHPEAGALQKAQTNARTAPIPPTLDAAKAADLRMECLRIAKGDVWDAERMAGFVLGA